MERKSAYRNRFDEEIVQRRRCWKALGLLVLITMSGTLGFTWLEGWPLWKGFYFTVITISTVGYGDQGISDSGAQFATLLLVFGLATASYAFSVLVQYTVNRESLWRRRMRRDIRDSFDHVIVVGFGRMGESLCDNLAREDSPFVIVENSSTRAQSALEHGYMVVQGSATEDEVLVEAGIERARYVVALTGDENLNMVISLTARELSSEVEIIARAESQSEARKLKRAGANRVVSPFHSGGVTISKLITHPKVAEFLSVDGTGHMNIALAEVTIEKNASIIGQKLRDYGRDVVPHVCFVALERDKDDVMIPPGGDVSLSADDILIVAGDPDEIAAMKEAGRAPQRRLAPARSI